MRIALITCIILCCSMIAFAQTSSASKIIHFKELQKILPAKAPDGFTREKPKGQTVSSSGISSSNASVEFIAPKKEKQVQTMEDGKQDSVEMDVTWSITIEIIDYAGMGERMSASLNMITDQQFENETENGYEKSIVFNGYKGSEKLHSQDYSRSCAMQLVVGDRFIVNANGNGFADVSILQSLLNSMELKKLETSK